MGCSSRAGRCHRPAEPSCLRSAARVGWRRRAPCRPRTSYVLALGAKQPAPNTQCRVNCARRLIWPIRALRQQAATCGSEWPRESGAHPWRVPTHSGFTRPRSGMKGPDWGLAGAGTTVKKAAISRCNFAPLISAPCWLLRAPHPTPHKPQTAKHSTNDFATRTTQLDCHVDRAYDWDAR